MSTELQFRLPDVGEGLTEAEIVSWSVSVGDAVVVNQMIVEIETAKSVVALPSPFEGVVATLHVAEGDTVEVGSPIITIAVAGDVSSPAEAAQEEQGADAAPDSGTPGPEQAALLVGYGPRPTTLTRRSRVQSPTTSSGQTLSSAATAPNPNPTPQSGPTTSRAGGPVIATKPPVRKLARDLGVDLTTVTPTGPDNTVTRDDVQRAAAPAQTAATNADPRETRIPIRGIRKHTAAAMVASAFTAPHVTEFITLDISATMELRQRISARREFRDVKLSPLAFVAKALLLAIKQTPEANSRWDEAAQEIVLQHYVNLGIAAATDHGLVVPNIKDAQDLSLLELTKAIAELAETARTRKTSPAQMSGGTITITNVGVFGVDTGTPILNPGEAAILAFGAIRRMPWVVSDDGGERIEPRWVTQLALSFDHRLMDGQQGSEFLARIAALLSDPALALL